MRNLVLECKSIAFVHDRKVENREEKKTESNRGGKLSCVVSYHVHRKTEPNREQKRVRE
jgi:hypothetical protein